MFDFSLSQIQNQILLTQFDATQVENQKADRQREAEKEREKAQRDQVEFCFVHCHS